MEISPYAFPGEQHETQNGNWNQTFDPGMTLRDYFAAKVAPIYLLKRCIFPYKNYDFDNTADIAYKLADAMLRKRNG